MTIEASDYASILAHAMDGMPGTALLVIALVWSLGSFLWRQIRKKEYYEWKDHI